MLVIYYLYYGQKGKVRRIENLKDYEEGVSDTRRCRTCGYPTYAGHIYCLSCEKKIRSDALPGLKSRKASGNDG